MMARKREWKPGDVVDWTPPGSEARTRAVVDSVSDSQIRLVVCETCEVVWASPYEIAELDVVSQIASSIDSKSFKQQLAELEAEEKSSEETDRPLV
jgi:hypothetical protein